MHKIMLTAIAALAMCCTTSIGNAKTAFTGEKQNHSFTIHGRLANYDGSGTERIWIVGSKRMLYLSDNHQVSGTPALDRINKVFSAGQGHWFSREIYGDFTVEPLAQDIKGHMRPIRILAVKNVVITENGKVIVRKKTL